MTNYKVTPSELTQERLKELSKCVAEKLSISANAWYMSQTTKDELVEKYLYQDLERVMRLAIEHGIEFKVSATESCALAWFRNQVHTFENITNDTTREQAVIVAVMKALLEVGV